MADMPWAGCRRGHSSRAFRAKVGKGWSDIPTPALPVVARPAPEHNDAAFKAYRARDRGPHGGSAQCVCFSGSSSVAP